MALQFLLTLLILASCSTTGNMRLHWPEYHVNPFVYFFFLTFSLLFAHSGCRPDAPGTQVQEAVEQEKNFKISIATGGGFTGLVRGFYLYSDGKVETWRRFPAQSDSILWTAQVEPWRIAEFAQQLERTGALKKTSEGTGNVTTRIIYSLPDVSYTWSWSSAHTAPPELKAWYDKVKQFYRELSKNQQ